jgi:hypothetical protein
MNKLETIAKEIAEIRAALDAECAPIEEISDMVEDLVNDPSKNGLSTIFVFSETGLNKPTATNLNVTTGLIENLDLEWSQVGINTQSDFIWMSLAIFDASGKILVN